MRSIAPRTGAAEITVAEEQEQYMPITVALYHYQDGARMILTRWQPSLEERTAIAAGEDIYVGMLGDPSAAMTPLIVRCGPGDWQVDA